MDVGEFAVMRPESLDALIGVLGSRGYRVKGPVVRDGAIAVGALSGVADLPQGCRDEQSPGHYRLRQGPDPTLFGWAVGPMSMKAELFPASQAIWRTTPHSGQVAISRTEDRAESVAFVGVRPCDRTALDVLDRVLARGSVADPRYADRRSRLFLVVVECGRPAATCFCASMGTGPGIEGGFDLALTELTDPGGHRFLVRVGTERGREVLSRIPTEDATPDDLEARRQLLASSAGAMSRHVPSTRLGERLEENVDHPRWAEVAERCLACGNCTLVCPTCFCCDVRDTTDLEGAVERRRTWSSCFDLAHSYVHGGPVRVSISSRYRQWATHKLSTWWEQFGTSGCVGCGRCITWCPVGIDITEEVSAVCGDQPTGGNDAQEGASP